MKRLIKRALIPMFALCLLAPQAHADIFALWLKPKVEFVSGTGEVFKRFEGSPGGGVEAGLKLLGMALWADALFMGNSQYLGTLYFGQPKSQPATVVFDSGSNWLTVMA